MMAKNFHFNVHYILIGGLFSFWSLSVDAQCLTSSIVTYVQCEGTNVFLDIDIQEGELFEIQWQVGLSGSELISIEEFFSQDEFILTNEDLTLSSVQEGDYIFQAIPIDSKTCTDTLTINVLINPLPNVSLDITPTEYCSGTPIVVQFIADGDYNVTLGLMGVDPSEIVEISTNEFELSSNSSQNLTINPSFAGISELFITVLEATNTSTSCSATNLDSLTVSILNPQIDFEPLDGSFCSYDTIPLTWSAVPTEIDVVLSSAFSFESQSVFENGQNVLITNVSQNETVGIDALAAIAFGLETCSASASIEIDVIAEPSAALTFPTVICSNDTLFLDDFIQTVYSSNLSYSITENYVFGCQNIGQVTDTICFSSAPQQNGILGIQIDLANGACSTQLEAEIIINALPELNYVFPEISCSGDEYSIVLYSDGIATVNYERVENSAFTSTFPSIGQQIINDAPVNLTSEPVTVLYEVNASNGICAPLSEVVEIIIQPEPLLSVSNFGIFCDSQPIDIAITVVPANTQVSWSRNSADADPSFAEGNGPIFDELNLTSSNALITYDIVYGIPGCADNNYSIFVEVTKGPTGSLADSTVFCPGDIPMLAINSTNAIQWSPSTSVNFDFLQSPIYTGSGNEFVGVTITDQNSCIRVDSTFVILSQIDDLSLTTPTAICANEALIIQSSENLEAYLIEILPEFNFDVDETTITIAQPFSTGTFSINISDEFGCSSEIEQSITVLEISTPSLAGPIELCQNASNVSYTLSNLLLDPSWGISGGEIIASNGYGAIVSWTDQQGSLTFSGLNGQGCAVSGNALIQFTEETSLPVEQILASSENLIEINPAYQQYVWGRLNLETLADEVLITNQPYLLQNSFNFEEFNYWCEYGNGECTTRAYLNNIQLGVQNKPTPTNQFIVYPNPAESKLIIDWSGVSSIELATYEIYSMKGDLIMTGQICNNCQLDVEQLSPALYNIIFFELTNGFLGSTRFAKM
jgi:hypothetical protein